MHTTSYKASRWNLESALVIRLRKMLIRQGLKAHAFLTAQPTDGHFKKDRAHIVTDPEIVRW